MSYDRNFVPHTYAEAILFADQWYRDSGFGAYLEGWRHRTPDADLLPVFESRQEMIRWAATQTVRVK